MQRKRCPQCKTYASVIQTGPGLDGEGEFYCEANHCVPHPSAVATQPDGPCPQCREAYDNGGLPCSSTWCEEALSDEIRASLPEPGPNDPPPGSWADIARMMASFGGDDVDWDAWKDQMKEQDYDR